MKICLINNLYKPYARGGADRIAEIMLEGLKAQGHDVFAVATAPTAAFIENGNYYLKSHYQNLGKMNIFQRGISVVWDLFNIKNYFLLKKIIEKEKVELAITHNLRGIGFLPARAIKKIKHVHILHDIQLIHPSGLVLVGEEKKLSSLAVKIYYGLSKFIIASPKCVISPSAWLLNEHISRGFFRKSKTKVIPNPALVPQTIPAKKPANENFRFLYVGEIEEHKGIALLLRAFCECRKKYGNITLDIIGKGAQAALMPDTAEIRYLGWQTKAEVTEAMQNADCLVMPSLCYENSPTVMYEAAALGLPVIASRIGGASELAHYLGGVLFAAANQADLAKKMAYVIKNPQTLKSIGDNSKRKIENYSVDNYLQKLKAEIATI